MQDHGLFQTICRVDRLDGDDKEYGYVVTQVLRVRSQCA